MSFSILTKQPTLRSQATSFLRSTNVASAAIPAVRTLYTQPNQPRSAPHDAKRVWPLKTLGGGLVAAGGGFLLHERL